MYKCLKKEIKNNLYTQIKGKCTVKSVNYLIKK